MIVVIGAGVAGATVALGLAERLGAERVLVLTKGALTESNTDLAQGGIAAAVSPEDVPSHVADTLRAGAGEADEDAVRVLCADGPHALDQLAHDRGARFDTDASGAWLRGMEGAHSTARIVHADGDATGHEVQRALAERLRSSNIPIREYTMLVDLIPDGGRVAGVRVLDRSGRVVDVPAEAVVLASGGFGRLFAHTTNPEVATGDGIAAAIRAGAVVADLEFYQFHPTALAVPGTPLVSEAVRGEGAVLLDRDGRRFMPEIDERAELAPRDVVSRAIARVMTEQDGQPVLLDATGVSARHGDAGWLDRRFPGVSARVRAAGLDWNAHPIPITPAAHYAMGGVATDLDGRTSIPGLYAAGEVARTGIHGANRLASNSLLEGLVFGRRVVDAVAAHADDPALGWQDEGAGPAPARVMFDLPTGTATGEECPARAGLQDAFWWGAGLIRTDESLREAARAASHVLHSRVSFTRPSLETRNLATVGFALAAAARHRTESRGAHQRADWLATDPAWAHPVTWRVAHPGELALTRFTAAVGEEQHA